MIAIRRFCRYVLTHFRGVFLTAVGLQLLSSLLDASMAFLLAPIADVLLHPDLQEISGTTRAVRRVLHQVGLPLNLFALLAVYMALNIARNGLQVAAMYWTLRTKYTLIRSLLLGTFDDFLYARWPFFAQGSQATYLNTITREIPRIGDAFMYLALLLANAIQFIAFIIIPLYVSWQISLACAAVSLLLAVPFFALSRLNYRFGRVDTETHNQMMQIGTETLGMAKTVIAFANQATSHRLFATAFERHRQATTRSQLLSFSIPLGFYPLGLLVIVAALATAQASGVPMAEVTVLLYALWKAVPVLSTIAGTKSCLEDYMPGFEQVMQVRAAAQQQRQLSGQRQFARLQQDLRFVDVAFAHAPARPVLSQINCVIPRGQMVAFVGESGAGKSTLMDLLLALHQPQHGAILVDGVSLAEYDVHSYRQRIGFVPQDCALFHGTIRANLLWAKPDAGPDELAAACRQANVAGFLAELPHGLDTVVGDRGVRLSGGQVQRVALARAILRRPELLLLDEATSALDTQSERLIQEAIERIAHETTVVVIAHRLSTIVNADYIYVLEAGRVVEEGRYHELAARGGPFRRMLHMQDLGLPKTATA